jgi:hypothetical protein
LCNGLDSGDIKENKNKKYNRAFKALEPVCEDLLEDEAEEEEESAVEAKAKKVKLYLKYKKSNLYFSLKLY